MEVFRLHINQKNSGIPFGNSPELFNWRNIAAQYPPRAKKIPCPKLNIPVNPQIKSTPRATIARDKYLPKRFNLKTGSNAGAAIINAMIRTQIQLFFCRKNTHKLRLHHSSFLREHPSWSKLQEYDY